MAAWVSVSPVRCPTAELLMLISSYLPTQVAHESHIFIPWKYFFVAVTYLYLFLVEKYLDYLTVGFPDFFFVFRIF